MQLFIMGGGGSYILRDGPLGRIQVVELLGRNV